MAKKVFILPCSGIGKASGEIGRQAAYQAEKLRPEQVEVVCLARLMIDDPETMELVRGNYVITLDGCPEDCARKNVARIGKTVDCAVHTTDMVDEHPEYQAPGVLNLGNEGWQLVELLAEKLAGQVDSLTAKEG